MSMSDEVKASAKKKQKKKKKSFKEAFIPMKDDPPSEVVNKIAALFAILVLVACLVVLCVYFYGILEQQHINDNITDIVDKAKLENEAQVTSAADPNVIPPPEELIPSASVQTETEAVTAPPKELLASARELLAVNPDAVGYVVIPDCVKEPVVRGTDNEFYLTHNIYGSKRQCGTCFADYRNDLGPDDYSDNIILYSHNQKDGSMFGRLDYYRWDPGYWKENPFIYFDTNYEEEIYVIFSSFVINTLPEHDNGREVFDYQNYINFGDTDHTYEEFIDEVTKRSQIITGVECTEDDKFLTLSTCSTEWDESRHVIVARKLRENETVDSFDLSLFEKNPNPKWPAIYYKYNGGTYIDE